MGTTSATHLSDPATFARAYDEHGPAVYGAALRVLGNPATAQDVAQDVFLRLWRRPAAFDPRRRALPADVVFPAPLPPPRRVRPAPRRPRRLPAADGPQPRARPLAQRAGRRAGDRPPEDRLRARGAAPRGAAGRPLRARRGRADRPRGARRAARSPARGGRA